VQVVTGLVPGPEFGIVETTVSSVAAGPNATVATAEARARFGQPFDRGHRVASFGLGAGDYSVRIRLLRSNGTLLVQQTARVTLADHYVLRVHITRDCVGVECPGAGSAALTACLQGRCVDPRCSAGAPEFCPEIEFCREVGECNNVASCATQSCDEGVCTEQPVADACDDAEWCNPTVGAGCVPFTSTESGVACGTICASSDRCRVGYWRCDGDAAPVCVDLFNREAGHVCGEAQVCDLRGECTACDAGAGCQTGCSRGAIACDSGIARCVLASPMQSVLEGSACSDSTCVDGQPCVTTGICDGGAMCVPNSSASPGFVASGTAGLTTSEAGTSAMFSLRLASQPLSDVIVTAASTDPAEGVATPVTLTFTVTNWASPQTVSITGVDDSAVDGAQLYAIRLSATSSDPGYSALAPLDVSVVNLDDDSAGVYVAPTSGLVTSESGATATFTIVLNAMPTDDVSVGLHSSRSTEGIVSPAVLTFTTANWNAPQTVTVTGADDAVADGAQAYVVVTEVATSADSDYNGIDPSDVALSNTDNDSAGIDATPLSGLTTTEAGGTTTFSVRLASEPASDVMLDVTSTDIGEGSVSPATLTFTQFNWNAPQTVTATGIDDDIVDGPQLFSARVSPAAGTDAGYVGVAAVDVVISNSDDETAGFAIVPASGLTTSESGSTANFTVALTSEPSASVLLSLSSSDSSEGTAGPTTLSFTAANWDTPRTVTITGVDDLIVDGNQIYSIVTAAVVSSDTNYSGLNPADVSVTNNDNDTPSVLVTPTSGLVTSEAGATATFTVRLATMPSATVSIALSSSDLTEGSVAPASLSFTTINWATPQTVTVTGVNDILFDGSQLYTVILATCVSTDPSYSAINPADVSVTNTDTTACTAPTIMCGGTCASCPTGYGILTTGCSGAMCVPTSCLPWYRVNGSACESAQTAYIKASNTSGSDLYGARVVLSEDGQTLAVGALWEQSNATGINGDQSNNSANHAGAVYVYRRSGSVWAQEAYVKASNTEADDYFGNVALSADGSVMAISANSEDSNATGIGGDQSNNLANSAGAVYLFRRTGAVWVQEAYIKASNTGPDDGFGATSLSADGTLLAVGAANESSNALGVGGDQSNNSAPYAGAVYLFRYNGATWAQEAYIKASNTEGGDSFGGSVDVSADGLTLAVSALGEDSNAQGINGAQGNNLASSSGALYVFRRTGMVWAQEAYIKASNADSGDALSNVSLSANGNTLLATAIAEASNATGVGGDQADNSIWQAGAAYVFSRSGTTWTQIAYLKSAIAATAQFGYSSAISSDGATVAIGAAYDSPADRPNAHIGLVYIFHNAGSGFALESYVRALNADSFDYLGINTSMSGDGTLIASAASNEASTATGVDGDGTINSLPGAGAVYLFTR
jgi:hypothetical protein